MNEPDDNAAADATWPDYQVPAEVTPDGPVAATPPADPATPPAQPAADPPAAPTGGAPGQPPGDDGAIPAYRLNETRERFEAIVTQQADQIRTLTSLVERLTAGQTPTGTPPVGEPAAPPSPQDLAIRERLLSVFPELKLLDELKEIAAKKADLLGAADAVPRWNRAETEHYDRYAETSMNTVYDKLAVLMIGDGKTGKDLDDLARGGLLNTFSQWVMRDPARAARFEAFDPKVIDEFVAAYKTSMIDPVRRDRNAALLTRAQNPPALPQGGPASAPSPAAPNTLNLNDEDAVHAAAWAGRDAVGAR